MASRRQDSGLFPEIVEQALQAHSRLPLRGEKHSTFQEFFVDTGHLDSLKTADWQVVFGRRGTGKTFLLGTLHERAIQRIDQWGVMSIRMTMQDCVASPLGTSLRSKTLALGYFEMFLQNLIEEIIGYVDQVIKDDGPLARAVGRKVRRKRREIEHTTLEMLQAIQVGGGVTAFDSVEHVTTREQSTSKQGSLGASFEGSLGVARPNVGLTLGSQHQSATLTKESMEQVRRQVPRYALVRRNLLRLLELLEVEFMGLLLDEWTVLDPSASTAIQPMFSEALKRTFAGTPRVSIKFAANRYQTRFDNRGSKESYRGLELGADLFEALDLDRVRGNTEELLNFFRSLLFKRLSLAEPGLRVFLRPDSDEPDPQFLLSIFRSERAFRELVDVADGNVRDFLILFNEVARRRQCNVRPTWTTKDIHDIAAEKVVANRLQEVEFESLADQLLQKGIAPCVQRTGSRMFLVERGAGDAMHNALDELLEKRLIHPCPVDMLSTTVASSHRAFLLGHAFWVGWARRDAETVRDAEQSDVWQAVTEGNVGAFTITPDILDTQRIHCRECGNVFAPEAKSYVLKRLCPSCFEPIPE